VYAIEERVQYLEVAIVQRMAPTHHRRDRIVGKENRLIDLEGEGTKAEGRIEELLRQIEETRRETREVEEKSREMGEAEGKKMLEGKLRKAETEGKNNGNSGQYVHFSFVVFWY